MSTFVEQRVEYVTMTCGHAGNGCGMSFAVTREFYDEIKNNRTGWYCPQGHSRVFKGPTAAEKLEQAEARERALNDQLTAAVREAETTRAALVRDRERFANGVCPCCNRSFENVRRHMTTEHPDYDVKRVEKRKVAIRCSCGRTFETTRGLRTHQGHQRRKEGPYVWDSETTPRWMRHLTAVNA